VTPPRYEHNRIVVVDKPDAVQTEIRLAQVAIPYRDPDLFTAEVYSSVTGGSPSARLYEEIRKKRGLSYGAQSFFVEPTQPGFFEASTFTKTETSAEALKVALDVLRDLRNYKAADATNLPVRIPGSELPGSPPGSRPSESPSPTGPARLTR